MAALHDVGAALRIGARGVARRPTQSAAVVMTMAVGIGVTIGVGSVFYAVLLAPLPYAEPHEIQQVVWENEGRRASQVSPAPVRALDEATEGVAEVAVARLRDLSLRDGELPRRIRGVVTTAESFATLGVPAQLGTLPTADDDRPGGPCTLMIGHGLWVDAFASDPAVIGRTVRLDTAPCVVLGVMPESFEFPGPYFAPGSAWVLAGPAGVDWAASGRGFLTFLRPLPGVTPAQLKGALASASGAVEAEGRLVATEWSAGTRAASKRRLGVLLAAALLVLLLAALNVLTLRIARGWERLDEVRTRVALGANRSRILGLLGVESAILTAVGGGLGVAVALGIIELARRMQSFYIPRMDEAALGVGGVVACLLLATVIGALGAAAPAFQAWRQAGRNVGRGPQRGASERGRRRLGRMLIAAETSLALVLLAGAGLLLESYRTRVGVDPGFDAERLLHARVTPSAGVAGQGRGGPDSRTTMYTQLEEHVSALPGVEGVALAFVPPGVGDDASQRIEIVGQGADESGTPSRTVWRPATASYFEVLGIPVLEGQGLGSGVDRGVVVNQTFVRRFLNGGPAIGQSIRRPTGASGSGASGTAATGDADLPWQIVGVVADVKEGYAYDPTPPAVYALLRDDPPSSVAILARTRGPALDQAPAVRRAVADVSPDQPVYALTALTVILDSEYGLNRLALALLAVFAASALVLTVGGIYGVVTHAVGRRLREVGIRIAVGARVDQIRWFLVRDNGVAVWIGTAVGLVIVALSGDVLRSLTPEWSGVDPLLLAVAAVVIVAAGAASSYLPARRASKLDPLRILRSE